MSTFTNRSEMALKRKVSQSVLHSFGHNSGIFRGREPAVNAACPRNKSDVAYLADIYDKFNAMNLQLQGNLVTLVKCKTVVSSFIGKLTLFKQNIGRREFY